MHVSFEAYLDDLYPAAQAGSAEARATDIEDRQARLLAHPHTALLQLSYPEMDFANRWCWQQFGPAHGECLQYTSEYPACDIQGRHSHGGTWLTYWLAKTGYDFGFNEWYFARQADRDRFLEFVPSITLGENYES